MNTGVLEALRRVSRTKQLDSAILVEALEAGILSAARKKFGPAADIEVIIDEEEDSLCVYHNRTVVEVVEDDSLEVDLEEAREYDPTIVFGEVLQVEVPLDDFGRNAIQAAKQIVVQRVREAEREQIYEEFQDRIGEIITGDVQQIERGGMVVNLGRTEALLPPREQIRRERYRQGDRIRAYLVSVEKTTKGPQIILSRTHPNFLKKLFRMEVPEIYDSVVEIMAISREAGGRSKVAVVSHDERVDPVGACVGVKGSRIQTIVRELAGEKIDIVPFSSDPSVLVSRALNPAKVSRAIVNDAEHTVKAIVPDDQLSLAIGRGGQNARLAAKLTGWKIDIVGETEHQRELEVNLAQRVDVSELPGVGPKLAQALVDAGYRHVQDLEGVETEELLRVEGIGEKTAEKISIAVAAVLEVLDEQKQQMLREMEEQARLEALAEQEEAERLAALEEAEEEYEETEDDEDAGGEDDESADGDDGDEDDEAAGGEDDESADGDDGGEDDESADEDDESADEDAGEPVTEPSGEETEEKPGEGSSTM